MDLAQVGQLAERLGVAQRNIGDAVVSKRGHGGEGRRLLATAGRGSGDEQTGEFAVEATSLPLGARSIPKCLPLGGEVSVPGGDTDQEAVIPGESGGIRESLDIRGLRRRVELAENFFRKGLRDPTQTMVSVHGGTSTGRRWLVLEEVGRTASGLDALNLSLSQSTDMSVHGILCR